MTRDFEERARLGLRKAAKGLEHMVDNHFPSRQVAKALRLAAAANRLLQASELMYSLEHLEEDMERTIGSAH